MKLNNLEVFLSEKDAWILITTEISQELAHNLEAALGQIFGYYEYQLITLRLSTPGGSLTALTAILQIMERWRSKGRKVRTEASFQAASAGALLLALGEVGLRMAQPYSSILFHHARIGGTSSAITAGTADMLATSLRRHDQLLLKSLVCHVTTGMGGLMGLAEEGAARCKQMRLNGTQIASQLDSPLVTKSEKWLMALTKMYTECRVKRSADPFRKYLERRLNQDSEMDVREAYCLAMIDGAYRAPLLLANATRDSSLSFPEHHIRLAA